MKGASLQTAAPLTECRHCRTPFRPSPREGEFCCAGCRFVSGLLHRRGLEDFYHFADRKAPAGSFVFHEKDYTWLTRLQTTAEAEAAPAASLTLDIQGISCAGCVWLLEAVFAALPGAISCVVHPGSGTMRLRWQNGRCDLAAYAADVQRFGYLLGPAENGRPKVTDGLTRRLGLCAALAMNAMLFTLPRYLGLETGDRLNAIFDLVSLGLATGSMAVGATYFFRRAAAALRRGSLHLDLPISLGLLFAYAGSVTAWAAGHESLAYFDFVCIFTFLMLLGRWTQERTVEANRRRLLGMRLRPGRVELQEAGGWREADPEGLREGAIYRTRRGQVVPVRSRLLERPAAFNLNWINGEPLPRSFARQGIVPSGARSIEEEPLALEALESWPDSQLAALLRIDSGTQWRNTGLQRIIRFYLAAVLVLAAAGFAFWLGTGAGWLPALQVLISVLVVSCPCAIGVALPLLDDLAAARMQQHGIHLREGSLWTRLLRVRQVLFDKTGTLTLESLHLTDPAALDHLSPTARSYLLRLVSRSLHPAASCLREILLAEGTSPASGEGMVREHTGLGLAWETPAGLWRLGRAGWALDRSGEAGGGTVFSCDGVELARFRFREEPRPGAAGQIAALRRMGCGVHLLSGDEPARVRAMASRLGLPPGHALGGLTPADKAALVRERWPHDSLMLGDGANDSLAFDAALCRGTPAVDTGLLEHKADFYILGTGAGGLAAMFRAARLHARATRTVTIFAISYNLAAVTAALAGWMNPLVAAVIMPLSSLASIGLVLATFRIPKADPMTHERKT